MGKIDYNRYFVILLMGVILFLSFVILKPYITTVIVSVLLAYAFFPLYRKLTEKIKRKGISALVMTIIVIILLVVPTYFILNAITREAAISFVTVQQKLATGNVLGVDCTGADNIVCRTSARFKEFMSIPQIAYYADDTLKSANTWLTRKISTFLLSIPARIVDVLVMFFVLFYLFRDGSKIVRKTEKLLPFKASHRAHIMKRLNEVMFAVVYVYFLIALVQGILGGLGFFFFGVGSPVLWGIAMALFALLPTGSVVIWGPAAMFMGLTGAIENNNWMIMKAFLLILYGIIVVGLSDNVIRLKVIGQKGKIHAVLILLGVLGGFIAFGFVGTIVGPLILALLMTMLEIYEEER